MANVTTYGELIDELTYTNYKYNRDRSPEITPEQWKVVYGGRITKMEARYQHEKLMGCSLDDIQDKVRRDLDKVAFARFGIPYAECDFEQCCQVVDENCQHIMFSLTENALLLKNLQFNMKRG